MADSVEDDDKWLYSCDTSADNNVGDKEVEQTSHRRQSEDLSQIFDNQVLIYFNV